MVVSTFPCQGVFVHFNELHQVLISFKDGNSVTLYVESAREKEVIRDLLGPIMSDNNIDSISWSKIK